MLWIKIFYAILLIVCIIFYVMYLWDFALVLLIAMIVIPIVMFIVTYITKKCISVEFAIKDDAVSKREEFPIQIRITNRSFFPIGKAEADIEYCNIFNSECSNFILLMPIQARNDQTVSFKLSSKYCGIVNIRCAGIHIYDPMRLFRFTVGKNVHTQIAVMPEGHDIGGQVCYTDRVNDESEVFSEFKPGDDPSEVFDLRGYNPGDKLNRIHWKLSSKRDEFIVKDYSLPVDIPCTVFLNLKCDVDSQFMLPVFDTLVETLVSVSQFLLENERIHSVVFYNGKAKQFVEYNIDDPAALAAAVRELILTLDTSLSCEPPENYFIEQEELSLSSFVFITSDPDPSIMEYIDESVDADIKNSIVVCTSPEAASEIPPDYSDVKITPVIIGRISASIKDIEV